MPPGAPGGAVAGPRSVHGQPPGKAPYPDDRTPEAEAARAQSQPPAAGAAAGAAPAAPAAAVAAAAPGAAQPTAAMADPGGDPATAGPRSVHGQPPGKGVHPDDPAYRGPVPTGPDGARSQQHPHSASAAQGSGGEVEGGDGSAGPRSVYGQPPGKNAAQIQQIAAASTHVEEPDEDEEPLSPLSAGGPPPTAPWQQPQQVAGAAAPGQGYAPSQATSGHGVRQRSAPPMAGGSGGTPAEQPASRKRPASQAAGDTGQRKRAANGAAGGGDGQPGGLQRLPTAVSSSHGGVPASLARSSSFHGGQGPATAVQQIRPMPGAPRSLQQRQQLANGVAGSTAGAARQPAGAPRARQPPAPAKPKQPAKPSGSGQRRPGSAQGAAAAVAHQYKPGDIVWAKIGVYPWWPAQLQRPTADEHFKPKHASTDLFCVFYGARCRAVRRCCGDFRRCSTSIRERTSSCWSGTSRVCAMGSASCPSCQSIGVAENILSWILLQAPTTTTGCRPIRSSPSSRRTLVSTCCTAAAGSRQDLWYFWYRCYGLQQLPS